MKKNAIIFLIFSLSVYFWGEKINNANIKELEEKLHTVAGKEKIRILLSLSKKIRSRSPQKSIVYAKQALEMSKNLNDQKIAADALIKIGISTRILGNFDEALESCQNSLSIYKELKDDNGIARSYKNFGGIYLRKYDFQKSLDYYFKALNIDEKIGDRLKIAHTSANIGTVFSNLLNFEQSLVFLKRALKIQEEIGDMKGMATTLDSIGEVYSKQKKYKISLDYRLRGLKLEEKFANKLGIAFSANNVGWLYFHLENYQKSLEYFLRSYEIVEEFGMKWNMASSISNVGRVHIKLKNFKKAQLFLNKSMKIANEINSKKVIQQNHLYFSELYDTLGDFKKSIKHFKLYFDAYISNFSEETNKKVSEMQIKYDTLKKEKENVILKKNNKILEDTNRIQKLGNRVKNIIIFATVLLLLMILIFIYRYYQYSQSELRHRKEKLKSLQLESKLKLFQARINPHFLFNSLSSLIRIGHESGPEKLNDTVKKLSNIYNSVLYSSEKVTIPLKKELDVVKDFLEIEKNNLNNRMDHEINIQNKSLLDCEIMPLTLLTLVENAVKHGLSRQSTEGKIVINIFVKDKSLIMRVIDNGIGFDPEVIKKGFGLYSIQERLKLHYKNKASFDIRSVREGGTQATIEIPYL